MNKSTKSIIQFTVLLGVGILLAWLSIKSVWGERDKIADSFATANYFMEPTIDRSLQIL